MRSGKENKMPGFEEFALVELFGHNRIAGKVTEAEIGGGKFIRVDVPELDGIQPVTRFYSPGAIYGITPMTEDTCLKLAKQLKVAPMTKWDARALLDADKPSLALLPGESEDDDYEQVTGG